jgi:hypothetical protein
MIGENCLFLATASAIYYLDQPVTTPITTYAPFAMNNFSSSMIYLTENNAFYKFVPDKSAYLPIYNFKRSAMEFLFENYLNRFMCFFVNFEFDANNNYIIQIAVEIFVDNDGIIYYIDEFQLNLTNPLTIALSYSPKLTKLYLSYMLAGQSQPITIIKNIDYDNCIAYDVNFIDLPTFLETIPPNPNSIQSAAYIIS